MKLTIEHRGGSVDQMAEEARRIADLLNEGFTSGQVVNEDGGATGWWELVEEVS